MADGPWTITYVDMAKMPALATPFTYLSTGNSVLGPFTSNDITLTVGYLGQLGTRFTVQILDERNQNKGLAALATTSASNTVTLQNLPSRYYLNVKGEGFWRIQVSP
jgi:hypothetical protein